MMAPQDAWPKPPDGQRLLGRLGEGSFAWVLATQDATGQKLAVKLLKPEAGPQAAWALAQESRLLARLPAQCFPAHLGEGRNPDGLPYLAMALAEGQAPEGAVGAAHARRRLLAVAEALVPLHDLGWVHGDLKPDNLREDEAGRIRILDLGLASMAGHRAHHRAGTPWTMAPEAWRQAPLDARSDLYALGVLTWAWVHGQGPWGGGVAALAQAHLSLTPPPLASGDAALDRLVARLLAKAPGDRPPSAQAVVAELQGLPLPEAPPPFHAATLVGLDAVEATWAQALAGGPALWLSGAPSSGKSSALVALRTQALAAGRPCLLVPGGGPPGAAARACLADASALWGQAPAGLALALAQDACPAELTHLEPAARLAALASAAAAFLAEAAGALGGLALLFDDVGPEDAPTWALLRALAGRVAAGAPLALAATGAGAAPGPWVQLGLAAWGPELLAAFLAARLGGPPPEGLVAALAPAEGLPRLAELLLADLRASGALRWEGRAWVLGAQVGKGLASGGLQAWAQQRLAPLGPMAQALAQALAVAAPAGPLPLPILAQAVASPESDGQGLAERLVALGLARVTSGGLALAFPGLAITLAHPAGGPAPDQVATALAQALLASGPQGPAAPPQRLAQMAELLLAGACLADGAEWLAWAGEAALRSGAPTAAARCLAAAVALGGPQLAPWRFALAEALRSADRAAEAAEAYALALAEGLAPEQAAAAGVGLAKARQLKGDYPGALSALAQAEAAAEAAGAPALLARAQLAEARLRAFKGEPARARALAESAVAIARAAGAEAVEGQALTLAGQLAAMAEPPEAEEAQNMLAQAGAIARRLGDASGLTQALEGLGNAAMLAGDLAQAPRVLAEAEAVATAAGLATEALAARLNRALAAAERGDAEAVPLGGAVAHAAEAAGRRFLAGAAWVAVALGATRQGAWAEAHEALGKAQALAEALGHALLAELHSRAALELALSEQALPAAEAALEALALHVANTQHAEGQAWQASLGAGLLRLQGQAQAAWDAAQAAGQSPFGLPAWWARLEAAEAALALGDALRAGEEAQAAHRQAQAWGAPWAEATAAGLLALAWAQGGRLAEAQALRAASPQGGPRAQAAWRALDALAGVVASPAVGPSGLSALAMAKAAQAIAAAPDEGAVARALLAAGQALLGAETGFCLSYEGGRLRRAIGLGLDADAESAEGFSRGVVAKVLAEAAPLVLHDAQAEWAETASVAALGLRTVVGLPIATAERLLGVLVLHREALEPLVGPAELGALEALAGAGAEAIAAKRAQEALQGEALTLGALSQALAARLPQRSVAEAALATAMAACGAERGFLLNWDDSGGIAVALALGPSGEALQGAAARPSMGLARHLLQEALPLAILDAGEAEALGAGASVAALGLRAVWGLPLPEGGALLLDTTELQLADPQAALGPLVLLVATLAPHMAQAFAPPEGP